MATINDMLFITQLFILLAITLFKIYNLMNAGQIFINKEKGVLFGVSISIMSFVILLLSFLFGLYIVMLEYDTWLYAMIFRLETLFLILNVLFIFIEGILLLNLKTQQTIGSYKSITR